jgi:hypothetical protein
MAELFIIGIEGGIYYGAVDDALATMTELTNVRNVSFDGSAGEADVTTRANAGWRATAPTLREATLTFQMIAKPSDAGLTAIKTAWLTSAQIELAALTEKKTVVGAEGPKGAWSITGFVRNEDLEDAIVYDVTAKLAEFDEWVVVAS